MNCGLLIASIAISMVTAYPRPRDSSEESAAQSVNTVQKQNDLMKPVVVDDALLKEAEVIAEFLSFRRLKELEVKDQEDEVTDDTQLLNEGEVEEDEVIEEKLAEFSSEKVKEQEDDATGRRVIAELLNLPLEEVDEQEDEVTANDDSQSLKEVKTIIAEDVKKQEDEIRVDANTLLKEEKLKSINEFSTLEEVNEQEDEVIVTDDTQLLKEGKAIAEEVKEQEKGATVNDDSLLLKEANLKVIAEFLNYFRHLDEVKEQEDDVIVNDNTQLQLLKKGEVIAEEVKEQEIGATVDDDTPLIEESMKSIAEFSTLENVDVKDQVTVNDDTRLLLQEGKAIIAEHVIMKQENEAAEEKEKAQALIIPEGCHQYYERVTDKVISESEREIAFVALAHCNEKSRQRKIIENEEDQRIEVYDDAPEGKAFAKFAQSLCHRKYIKAMAIEGDERQRLLEKYWNCLGSTQKLFRFDVNEQKDAPVDNEAEAMAEFWSNQQN